ncbi:OmpA family protein [Pseudogemmobacter faecipullorum]|uniref:OmpA family protein n=1 Tax=Pseudogemmobacter faecipullorum TaxID=2755041 RepID=A0ABS8CGM8_9RHOB|nr:OmpA family protein [Pseudogemmobacter faecipullorum]MCB5408541.1 OmpA family protein [Pseudogemmobacter faecipullorum]
MPRNVTKPRNGLILSAGRSAWFGLKIPALLLALSAPAAAFEPSFTQQISSVTELAAGLDSYAMPVGPWQKATGLPVQRVEGQVSRRAWRLNAPGATLFAVLLPLREQLQAAGWQILFECETRDCGGFDFRFSTEVLPEPDMHVDLNQFRFLSARRGEEALSLLISRSGDAAFVQQVAVGPEALAPLRPGGSDTPPQSEARPAPLPEPVPQGEGDARLAAGLPLVMEDLVFESGSARLRDGDYASLQLLADWLGDGAERRLILVGHTDLSGSLQANITLSKRRAEAVREALIRGYKIAPARLEAEGAGPLAPRSENYSEAGRQKNRRVEAIPAPG